MKMKLLLLPFVSIWHYFHLVTEASTSCRCSLESPPCSWSSWTQWSDCKDRCPDHHMIRTRQPCCEASRRNGSCLDQCLKICNATVDSSIEISEQGKTNKRPRETTTKGRWHNFARRDNNIFEGMVLEGPHYVLDGKLILTSSTPLPITTTLKSKVDLPDPNASKLSDIHSLAIAGVAMGSFICLAVCCCLWYFIFIKNKERKQRKQQVQITTSTRNETNTSELDF